VTECDGRPPAPFVVGVARSGTTLLRMMLDSHPSLAIPGETHFAGRVISAFGPGGAGLEGAVKAILESPFWPGFGIPSAELEQAMKRLPEPGPAAVLRTFYELSAAREGKERWGDKTPPYLERMGALQELLPEARFIHVVRDGRDVALSVIPLWFGPDDVEEAALHWSKRIADARRQAQDLSGYLEVRYEDLVRDTAGTLRSILEFIELPWDPSVLEYHRRAEGTLERELDDLTWRDGRTISASAQVAIHALTADPPRLDRVERWRREMSPEDRRAFQRIARSVLADLDYPLG
jgi:hypothetical protein